MLSAAVVLAIFSSDEIFINIPCVCFSFGQLCFSKHILDLGVFLHKLNPDDELCKHLNCPLSKLSFSLQKPVSRAVPLRVVFLAGLTSLSTGPVHFFSPPSSQQWPWEVDIQSTHRCEHAHWYIHSAGVYIHTPIHRLMISVYTFFSLPFFPFSFPPLYLFFVSPSLCVCSLSFIPPLFMFLLCCLALVARLDGWFFWCGWEEKKEFRNLQWLLGLTSMQICLVDSQYYIAHVGYWSMRHNHPHTCPCLTWIYYNW